MLGFSGWEGREDTGPWAAIGSCDVLGCVSSPVSKITYESKYCFLPFPVPDPLPHPAKGYFLLLTVLAGVEFLRNKCPIQSNARAGVDGVLGQFVVPGEELKGRNRLGWGAIGKSLPWWSCLLFLQEVTCVLTKEDPIPVSSKNRVTSVPPDQPSHFGVSLFLNSNISFKKMFYYLFTWLYQVLVASCRIFDLRYSMRTLSYGMWGLIP